MRLVLDDWQGGVIIGGTRITNLRYADDTALVAESAAELLNLVTRLEDISNDFGLEVNYQQTKVMIVDSANDNQANVQQIGRYEVVA